MIWLLLALFLWPGAAWASDTDLWWASAEAEAGRDGYKLIDTAGFLSLIRSPKPPLIIDVRADYEFEAGHVPGSLNLEFDLGDRTDLSPAKREAFEALAGQDRKRRLVLYCRSFR
jgi:3-mercaptopyruvate sulfurtransferase SseA